MSIFKISKKSTTDLSGGSKDKIEVAQAVSPDPEKGTDLTEGVKIPDGQETTNQPHSPESDAIVSDGTAAKNNELMVKIEGPVGRVFTDALNKMLAIEGFAAMIMPPDPSKTKDQDDDRHSEVSVYVSNISRLNTEEIVQISNLITRSNSENFLIAIEGLDSTASAEKLRTLGILEQVAESSNAKIFYSVGGALEDLRVKLK